MSIKRFVVVLLTLSIGITGFFTTDIKGQAKTVVERRLADVKKYYPNGSKINEEVFDEEGYIGGGCNALVMFATLRMFHEAYTPSSDNFKQVGKTTSTKSNKNMKKLFRKAKVGDVIRWRNGYTDAHFAIFQSMNSQGVYLYEANFYSENLVWYEHFWKWKKMSIRPTGGATKVNVYRFRKYKQVNQKQYAKNFNKGDTFTVSGIQYQVTKTGATQGKVKVIGYEEDADQSKIPKYLYLRLAENKQILSFKTGYGSISKNKNANAAVTYQVEK